MSMEDLSHGQRIGNYSIEYRLRGSQTWEMLVPPVQPKSSAAYFTTNNHIYITFSPKTGVIWLN